MNYYNDHEPFACRWLENLIAAGELPAGVVDGRDVREVRAEDLRDSVQQHLFAGVGGWPYALRLAGWPEDRPVFTASCPCPPFSTAGSGQACPACGGGDVVPCPVRTGYFICIGCDHPWYADGRHLWPEVWRIIRDLRPPVCFGEQVASSDGVLWLAGVRASLEAIGYAVGAADLPAGCVGAPHRRQRLFWVAEKLADDDGERPLPQQPQRPDRSERDGAAARDRQDGTVDYPPGGRRLGAAANEHEHVDAGGRRKGEYTFDGRVAGEGRSPGRSADAPGRGRQKGERTAPKGRKQSDAAGGGPADGLGDADSKRCGGQPVRLRPGEGRRGAEETTQTAGDGTAGRSVADAEGSARDGAVLRDDQGQDGGEYHDPWGRTAIFCSDGNFRRISVEPGVFPLAHGVPRDLGSLLAGLEELGIDPDLARQKLKASRRNRSGRLEGYGNAIVPSVAALFVRAYAEAKGK